MNRANSRFTSEQLLLRPSARCSPPSASVGRALLWGRVAGLLREGSRLYSYLLRGRHHCPETTQPTTSPRRRPRCGRTCRPRRCPTPVPAPAQWAVATRTAQGGWAGAGQDGRAGGASVSPWTAQPTPSTGSWQGGGAGERRACARGPRRCPSRPVWERPATTKGALTALCPGRAEVPPLTRGLMLGRAGWGKRLGGGVAEQGRSPGSPWGAALQPQPSLCCPVLLRPTAPPPGAVLATAVRRRAY